MTDVQVGESRQVARVQHLTQDRMALFLELRNGQVATCTAPAPVDLAVGDVVFIGENRLDPAPKELWHEELWVGVVRVVKNDRAIVDVDGKLRSMPVPRGMHLEIGNTVEGSGHYGIEGVVSDESLHYLDRHLGKSVDVKHFKRQPTTSLTFDNFGGYEAVKERARELIELPLSRKKALDTIGAQPVKGVLFTGESGTGKTLLARIIASLASAQLYEVSGPQVLSKWYGESEQLIREIFDDAAKQLASIIFFDEIDSLAVQRSDESHEASRRIVGQLLTSMDGFSSANNVIVVATTNRPQDIDIALRRPGRFDWEIHFPLPSSTDRESILNVTSASLKVAKWLPHRTIAEKTDSWSPAELRAIWSEAALLAVQDDREIILEEDYFGGFDRVLAQRAQVTSTRKQAARKSGDPERG